MTISRRAFLAQSSVFTLLPGTLLAGTVFPGCGSGESPEGSFSAGPRPNPASPRPLDNKPFGSQPPVPGTPSGSDLIFNRRILGRDPYKVSTDIRAIVQEAADTGRPLRVLAGGHGYLGSATIKDGLVIDMRNRRQVTFDLSQRQVTVEAGTRFVDFYRALLRQYGNLDLIIPTGSCPTVGMSGYTLGGGFGHLSRRFGLMCDNVVAMTVVFVRADGTVEERVLSANSAGEDAELFWGLRGAGGSHFAVVKDFTFQLRERPRNLRLHDLRLRNNMSADEIQRVITIWLQWMNQHLDNKSIASKLAVGSWWLHISGAHEDAGPLWDLRNQLQFALDPAYPQWDLDYTMENVTRTFKGCDSLDACEREPKKAFAARSAFLQKDDLPGRAWAIAQAAVARRSCPDYGGIELMGWRMNSGGVQMDNAFVHRNNDYICQFYAEGMEDESAPWMMSMFRAVTAREDNDETLPGYQNYSDARVQGVETGFPKAYFSGPGMGSSTVERLERLRGRYRPLFG